MKKAFLMAIISVCAAVSVAFSLPACNFGDDSSANSKPPIIIDPEPDEGGTTNPDEGETTDPEPDEGGTTNPDEGETTDPEPDEGGTTNPDEGETTGPEPDEGGTTEPEPDLDAPKTVAELFKNGNEEYQAIVSDTLNDYLYENMVSKSVARYDLDNVEDAKWEIVDDGNGNIDKIRLFFFYNSSDTSRTYLITSVEPKTEISVDDLCEPVADTLNEAFDTNSFFGARYAQEYTFSYDPSVQDTRSELRDALNTKAANDGIIDRVDSNTMSFIKDNGSSLNTTLEGTARNIVVLNLNENGYEEYTVQIKENQGNNNDTTLIENLKNNLYYDVKLDYKSNTYSNNFIENQDLPENTADKAIKQ